MAGRGAERFNPALGRGQTAWLIVCAVLALAPLAPRVPIWLALGAGSVIVVRAWLWYRRLPLPPRWLLMLMVIAGTAGVLLSYRTLFGRDPGAALLVLFLALKLMELRRLRDGMTVVALCWFLQITVYFHSQDPQTAALTLGAALFATATLIRLNDEAQSAAAVLRRALLMLAQALPFMLALFMLFPRVQEPLWAMPLDAYAGLSGLSDNMSPGSISELTLSGAIAFRARFEAAPPPRQQLYWRGPVLAAFDGRTWRQERPPLSQRLPYAPTGEALAYSVTLEAHNKHWLFALDLPGRLPEGALIGSDYQIFARAPVRTRLRYETASHPAYVAGEDEPEAARRAALQLPEGSNPRALALARQWRAEAPGAEAFMRRALAHFREQNFVYTLTPPLLGAQAVDEFLFETRRGFCEHYASSFVFLMRAGGVPARVVTGYQGGEINPFDDYLIVRQSDAHAWAEVWLAGRGWVRADPTAMIAPSRVERGLAAAVPAGEPLPFLIRADLGWLRALRFRWEAGVNAWNQWVLGYNSLRQREVLNRLGIAAPDWREMTAILALLCGAMMLAATLWALRRHVRLDPAQQEWERLSRKLRRRGLARRPWEGPLDYAGRVGQSCPALADEMSAIARLYARQRYGPHPDKNLMRQLAARVRALQT